MASLVSSDGTSFELAEAETLIGRGGREHNDPPKVDVGPLRGGPTVSRQHARVFRRSGQWYLRVEPEARNPTLVGGRRIPGGEEATLAHDADIQLGDVVLTFKSPMETPAYSPDSTITEENGHTAAPTPPPTAPPIAAAVAPEPTSPASEPSPSPDSASDQHSPTPPPKTAPASQPTPAARPAPAAAPRGDNWAARLPERPALLTSLGTTEFKRVNPFRGLMIDEEAWADAHDYHRLQDRLHLLGGHGWGIVEGLHVVADAHAPNTLVIRPGVAFDPHGRALMVPQERRLPVTASDGTTLYVILRLHEELAQPQRFWNDLDEYTRVIEKCQALVQSTPPSPPGIELARVTVRGPVRNAGDPMFPQPGDLDLRFRERLTVRPRPDLAVAEVVPSDRDVATSDAHRLGLRYLLREIGVATGYRPRWAGVVRLGDSLPPVSLLYLTGTDAITVGDEAIPRLRAFLDSGGVLFADGCRDGKGNKFAPSIEALAKSLGSALKPVERWHPILAARHVFAEPPLGSHESGKLVEGGGLVLSTADYGCAWQGGAKDRPLGREAIRAALELGVNVAVHARQRQQPLEVIELES